MEKRYLSLRGIAEILSEKEMRKVVGASGGTGSGFPHPRVAYECCLIEGSGKWEDDCFRDIGLCAGPDCETCMGYSVAQVGFYCWNISCMPF